MAEGVVYDGEHLINSETGSSQAKEEIQQLEEEMKTLNVKEKALEKRSYRKRKARKESKEDYCIICNKDANGMAMIDCEGCEMWVCRRCAQAKSDQALAEATEIIGMCY